MVPDVRNILFATDLREQSRFAFHYAANMAARFNASLSIIHVLEKAPGNAESILKSTLGEEQWNKIQEEHSQGARANLISKRSDYESLQHEIVKLCSMEGRNNCAEGMFDDIPLLVVHGDVAEEVLKAAEANKCDLIIMGSHTGFFGRKSIGGAAKEVLNKAAVPVIIVPPAGKPD